MSERAFVERQSKSKDMREQLHRWLFQPASSAYKRKEVCILHASLGWCPDTDCSSALRPFLSSINGHEAMSPSSDPFSLVLMNPLFLTVTPARTREVFSPECPVTWCLLGRWGMEIYGHHNGNAHQACSHLTMWLVFKKTGQCRQTVGHDRDVFWACAGDTTIPLDACRNTWLLQPHCASAGGRSWCDQPGAALGMYLTWFTGNLGFYRNKREVPTHTHTQRGISRILKQLGVDFGCTHEILHNSFSRYSLRPTADVRNCWSTLFVPSKISEKVWLAFLILFKKHF